MVVRDPNSVKGINPKARIIAAGLSCGLVARTAEVEPYTVSRYLAGRRRRRATQEAIWAAYRELSGSRVGFHHFWGEFASPARTRRPLGRHRTWHRL